MAVSRTRAAALPSSATHEGPMPKWRQQTGVEGAWQDVLLELLYRDCDMDCRNSGFTQFGEWISKPPRNVASGRAGSNERSTPRSRKLTRNCPFGVTTSAKLGPITLVLLSRPGAVY